LSLCEKTKGEEFDMKQSNNQTIKNIVTNINDLLEILDQQYIPKPSINKVLCTIVEHHVNNQHMAIISAYQYGFIQGKRVERNRRIGD